MKSGALICMVAVVAGVAAFLVFGQGQEKKQAEERNFYERSLHYTNKGLEFWYAGEQGGVERITGLPFSQIDCARCHVRTCDACHQKEVNGKLAYALETAKSGEACIKCHGMESLEFARKNPGDERADVHFRKGMGCMDCHSAREIHGDGKVYDSMQSPGAMDTRCEKCHQDMSKCQSHTLHKGKVDCNACHVAEIRSCVNCHFETRITQGKSVSQPLSNILFLVNHEGRVTTGSMHTFVYKNKTMITFAPSFPHAVVKKGRVCIDCHGTAIVKQVQKDKLTLMKWENGQLRSPEGVVPVFEGMTWRFTAMDYRDGKFVPLSHPEPPLINFAGYSQPLSREQLAKMAKVQPGK